MRLPGQRRTRAREMRPRATSVYKAHRTRTTASTTLVSCLVLVAAAAQVGSAQAYSAFPGQRTHAPCTTDADCIYDGCVDSPLFQSPAACCSTPIIYYSPISYRACGQSSRVGDGLDQYRSCDPPAAPGWGNCNECPERPVSTWDTQSQWEGRRGWRRGNNMFPLHQWVHFHREDNLLYVPVRIHFHGQRTCVQTLS